MPIRPAAVEAPARFTPGMSGRDILGIIFRICRDKRVSDIQMRTDRPVYIHTNKGVEFLGHLGPLSAAHMDEVLSELIHNRESGSHGFGTSQSTDQRTEEKIRQAKADFAERRVDDFSCDGILMGDNGERSGRLRVQAHLSSSGLGVTCRILNDFIPELESLGIDPDTTTVLRQSVLRRAGLCLVTGPTGSGKSTTLAALMQQINVTRRCHAITIEDPIEYLFRSEKSIIQQREVGLDTRTFANALKRVLRQDPDVIMIGEMRDLETISAAITAAETGHLVLTTLHTPDAVQSIDRIIDVFPPYQQQQVRMQISHVLIGVCYQQLIPLMGGGRTCATEILFATPAVRNCIREGKTSQIRSIMQTSSGQNMHTMDQDLARLVWDGFLSSEQAMLYALDPKELERILMDMSPLSRRSL